MAQPPRTSLLVGLALCVGVVVGQQVGVRTAPIHCLSVEGPLPAALTRAVVAPPPGAPPPERQPELEPARLVWPVHLSCDGTATLIGQGDLGSSYFELLTGDDTRVQFDPAEAGAARLPPGRRWHEFTRARHATLNPDDFSAVRGRTHSLELACPAIDPGGAHAVPAVRGVRWYPAKSILSAMFALIPASTVGESPTSDALARIQPELLTHACLDADNPVDEHCVPSRVGRTAPKHPASDAISATLGHVRHAIAVAKRANASSAALDQLSSKLERLEAPLRQPPSSWHFGWPNGDNYHTDTRRGSNFSAQWMLDRSVAIQIRFEQPDLHSWGGEVEVLLEENGQVTTRVLERTVQREGIWVYTGGNLDAWPQHADLQLDGEWLAIRHDAKNAD